MPSSRILIKRIAISILVGLLIGALINEASFRFLRESDRGPQVVELVIPMGTAEGVARGEASPSIPNSMDLVQGDTLLVKNEDVADHQLGPLWIPAGASASLALDTAQSFAYDCSFQPNNIFGLDVHDPITLSTRLNGILFSGLPMGLLIAVYAVILPLKKKNETLGSV